MSDIRFIKKIFRSLKVFEGKEEILEVPHNTYINELKVVTYPKNHILFKRGEFGTTYYIVLQGDCYLLQPKQEEERAHEKKNKEKSRRSSLNNNNQSIT